MTMNFAWKIFRSAYIFIAIYILIATAYTASAQSGEGCKHRLADAINSYQPAIVPVCDLFGRVLYFDRKLHPENTDGTRDTDEIWVSKKLAGQGWSVPRRIDGPLNTPGADVLFSLSPDAGSALVYGKYTGLAGSKDRGFSIARNIDGQWDDPRPLEIEDFYNLSSQFYGCLSYDGRTLVMALERRDGYGRMDIYVSFFNKYKNNWTEPLNLGDAINTDGIEATACLAWDNRTLYFASGGRDDSFGKMDLYMSRRLDDTWRNWSKPVNLGPAINSEGDDSGLWPMALADTVFFVSQDSLTARDGIYMGCLADSLRPLPYRVIYGDLLRGADSMKFIGDVKILLSSGGEELQSLVLSSGEYAIVAPADRTADLRFTAIGYRPVEIALGEIDAKLPVMERRDAVFNPEKLEKELIDKLYFDTDSVEISQISKKKLINKLKSLDNYPKKDYVIVGHADQRGEDKYNLILSMKRAQSVGRYLLSQGIPLSNIKMQWQGEREPASDQNSLNRRVEIYILNQK
ncbi:MAG: OmpA family protein [Candidatus Kapaibacterium sp.]